MSANSKTVGRLYEQLGEREKVIIAELICRLLPDDVATTEDIAAILKSQEEYERGDIVRMEDIDWDAEPVLT